jgi:hypothetical protein
MSKIGWISFLIYWLIAGCVIVILSSCGGPSTADAPLSTKPWKDQNHDERMITMKKLVYPAMKSEFAAFDPKEFGDMTCITCHGEGAKTQCFTMPNPKLPKLPTSEEGIAKLKKEHAEIVTFMATKVVPKMAAFVGESPYDPKTHEGFGCFRCHPKAN